MTWTYGRSIEASARKNIVLMAINEPLAFVLVLVLANIPILHH